MELSLFKNFTSRRPQESTLEAVAEMIREDGRVKALTESYRSTGEKAVKEACPLFAVAALFKDGKRESDICQLTGLGLVDIDHVGQPATNDLQLTIEAIRARAVADPHTLMCYTTISGDGLRVIFRYELDESFELRQQKQWYQKAFAAGNIYYERVLGVAADWKCKNIGRLSGVAHDPQMYVNMDAAAFTQQEVEAAAEREVERQRVDKRRRRELSRLQTAYERTVKPEVEADGGVYAPGSHNDYVMRVGYKLNELGFDEEAAVEWARDTFSDYDKAGEVIRSCYKNREEFGSRKMSGTPTSARGEGGKWASVEDIEAFLKEHIRLRHNIITQRVEAAPMPDTSSKGRNVSPSDEWQPLTDRVVNSLWAEMARTQKVIVQDIYRVIESDFVPEFHPFKDYLKTLPPTPPVRAGSGLRDESCSNSGEPEQTGTPPVRAGSGLRDESCAIAALARTVRVKGGEEQQALFERYLRKWLVGMVAGWAGTDEVNHVILVLIGEQGSYKTTWFQYLLPPELRRYFYTKTNASRMMRDDLLTLAQYGLVCCEELDTMRPAELNQLKAAVTMPSIVERAAYAHFHEHRKHIASFCGTGNNIQFLSDPTGNRRWLPFEVESIVSPREHPFDYEGIYGEAYSLYLSGFSYWFSRDEILRLSEHNKKFETPRLEVELVQQYFRVPMPGEAGEFMPVALALQIVACGISQKLSPVYMGRAFSELGFEQRVIKNVRGYVVVRNSVEEMQARRRLAALQMGRGK